MEDYKKKSILNRVFKNPYMILISLPVIYLAVVAYLILSKPKMGKEIPELKRAGKNFKSVQLGELNHWFAVYKLTVDSIDYLVVENADAVSIIKHSP